MSSHVILGGNGVVGRETITALLAAGHPVASVNRSAARSPGVRSVVADLREPDDVRRALVDADVAYLTVGLPTAPRCGAGTGHASWEVPSTPAWPAVSAWSTSTTCTPTGRSKGR